MFNKMNDDDQNSIFIAYKYADPKIDSDNKNINATSTAQKVKLSLPGGNYNNNKFPPVYDHCGNPITLNTIQKHCK